MKKPSALTSVALIRTGSVNRVMILETSQVISKPLTNIKAEIVLKRAN